MANGDRFWEPRQGLKTLRDMYTACNSLNVHTVAIAPRVCEDAQRIAYKIATGEDFPYPKFKPYHDPAGLADKMGTTNGIEVSPDGSTLYVNESVQRNIWAFTIRERRLQNKRLLIKFNDHGFDGMRCDVDGNLYVTRHGKGTVVKISPQGVVLKEIDVLGPHPTNICFGGPDGRTAYVTEAKERRLVQFRVDRAGLEWERRPRS